MDVPPSPASGLRMQELGDRLVVYFRPRRSWGAILFLGLWFLLWTVGGLAAALHVPDASPGEAAFLLFWLCGWVAGECVAVGIIAWQLFGRELLTVTSDKLEVRQEIGRFARTKRYEAALVQDVTAARVPHDEDEKPRKDFCFRVSYGDETVRIGEGMGEREAEYNASIVLSRIRPRSWWGDEERAAPMLDAAAAEPERKRRVGVARAVMIALPIVAFVAAVVLLPLRRHHAHPRAVHQAARPARLPWPLPEEFANAREYAAAVTSYVLQSGRAQLVGHPTCGPHVTWTKWTCRATVNPGLGSLGARAVPFRCSAVATGGVTCGLATQVPLGSPRPPDGSG